jgi:serine/threonine protein phosphatase 1
MGNHDRMFARFLRAPHEPEPGLRADLSWLHPRLGGAETLASWGVRAPADRPVAAVHADAAAAVTAAERAWIEGLPLHHRLGPWLFVHAGIRPGLPLDAQDDTDLVWIREPFLSDRRDHGALVVHGHTVAETVEHRGNRLNLDTGAAYGGPLSVVALDPSGVFLLTPRGRVRIDPQP